MNEWKSYFYYFRPSPPAYNLIHDIVSSLYRERRRSDCDKCNNITIAITLLLQYCLVARAMERLLRVSFRRYGDHCNGTGRRRLQNRSCIGGGIPTPSIPSAGARVCEIFYCILKCRSPAISNRKKSSYRAKTYDFFFNNERAGLLTSPFLYSA